VAISTTLLTSGTSTVNSVSTYVTASVSPAANSFLVAAIVYVVTGGATETVSGLGLTWTQQGTVGISASTRLTVFTAPAGASPGSGAVTFTHSANGATQSGVWSVLEIDGHDPTGTVVQAPTAGPTTGTAASVTFATAGNSANRMFTWIGANDAVTYTPGTNWTELLDHAENTPSCSEQVQWRSDAVDTVGAATLSLSASWGEVGLEIKNLNATPSAPLVAGQQVAMHRASTW
jgi:hypothetical protein